MGLIGSVATGMGSVPTAAGGTGGGGDGTLVEITSEDGSVVVRNPNGPVTDLSVPGGSELLLGLFQYGGGDPANGDNGLQFLPATSTSFYLTGHIDCDHAPVAGPVTLYPITHALQTLRLVGWIDDLNLVSSDEGTPVTMTVAIDVYSGGVIVETLTHDIVGPIHANLYFDVSTEVVLAAGQAFGVRLTFTDTLTTGSTLRASFRVLGAPDSDLGPFVSDDLTVRLETAEGHTIETDGDNVARWPNEGSVGTSHDYVPVEGTAPPTVVTDDDGLYVHYDGNQQLAQATIPASGEFSPPVGAQFAPFWHIAAFRVSEPGIRGLKTWVTTEVFNFIFAACIPVSANFKLIWQYLEDVDANVETVPNVDGSLLDKWVVAEWGWDGTTFTWVLNAANVTLTGGGVTDPSGGNAAAEEVRSYIGGNPTFCDYRAMFTYRVMPSFGEKAKTRAYFLATYPVT